DLKVSSGYFAVSKKSGDLRCASRFVSRVLMLLASILTSTVDFVGSLSSMVTVPSTLSNVPRTVLTIMWRTENCALLWAASMTQSLADADAERGNVAAMDIAGGRLFMVRRIVPQEASSARGLSTIGRPELSYDRAV